MPPAAATIISFASCGGYPLEYTFRQADCHKMEPPSPKSSKRALFAACAVLVLAVAGIVAWRLLRTPIGTEEVAAFLNKAVGAGKVQFSDARIEITRMGESDLQVTVAATARAMLPLYSRVDATEYLRGTLNIDPESTAEVRRLMADKNASQGPEFSRLRPFPPDPYQAVILKMASRSGAAFAYQATIGAHRDGDTWTLALVSGAFSGGSPTGDPRSAFGDSSFIAGDAGDDARLRGLAADLQTFAERVDKTQRSLDAAHSVALGVRRDAYMARLATGSVFRGTALRPGEQQGTTLYLEITGLTAGNGVTALLRNAGGWHYARAFQGSWLADEEYTSLTLNLTSLPDQAVRNAGPFLENTQAWTFDLRMEPKGDLSEANRFFAYRFQFVNAGLLPSLKAALDAEFERAISVTAPGSLYRGTAVSKASGASEPILLRFVSRSDDGESVQASIESTSRSWKRRASGAIMGNSRRSGGEPVRLRTGAAEAVEEAPGDSVLGSRDDLGIRLGVAEGALAGEDERFTYRFATVETEDLNKADDAARVARAGRFSGVLRDGIAYDGTIRDDQGSVTQARLEIARIDRKKGTVAASIHSLVLLNVYQDFTGTLNPSDGSLTLVTTSHGKFDSSDDLAVPFLVAPVAHTLQLALVGNAITGVIKGDSHWAMEFPVGAFLAAQTEGAEPDSPPANGSVFPAFPKASGAYALVAGEWKPLPHNNGRVVVETNHPMSGEELTEGPIGLVSLGVRRLTEKGEKLTFLDFDGKDARPELRESAVVLLFVGAELTATPQVELAPVEAMKDGRRRIEILGGPAGAIRFGEQRAAAYVRRAGPGSVLLTTTSALAPGPYAFNADVAYELTVKQ